MPHLETFGTFHFGIANPYIGHTRARRAIADQVDEPVDRGLIAFEMRFDGAIGAVADPAVDAEPFSLPLASVHGGNFQACDDFIRIEYGGVERNAWLDLSAVHVAFFRGHLPQAVYVCRPGELSCRTDP